MGEIIAWVVQGLGVYVVYAIGKYTIRIASFGSYSVEPYRMQDVEAGKEVLDGKYVSRSHAMILGFIVLVTAIVVLGLKTLL